MKKQPPFSFHRLLRPSRFFHFYPILHRPAAGAIIGEGDCKCAPFLVLTLSLWYRTIFLFLEQIAPSHATHARTCWENFCEWSAGEVASEIPEMFDAFWPTTQCLCLLEFCLSVFAVSCYSLSEVRQCRIQLYNVHITEQAVPLQKLHNTPL